MSAKITNDPLNAYDLTESVLRRIRTALTVPETGGILGGNENLVVTAFHHDDTGRTTARTYTPDTDKLNEVIREWSQRGITFVGFVHSHPSNRNKLSAVDIRYAEKIKSCCGMSKILMLLYLPSEDSFHQFVL